MDPFDFDCLGCLMAAHQSGDITDEEYTEVLDVLDAETKGSTAECPRCGKLAYISEYEPGMMHCPACGLYSFREDVDSDIWTPAMQGAVWGKAGA